MRSAGSWSGTRSQIWTHGCVRTWRTLMRTNESLVGGRPCAEAPAHRENTISRSLARFAASTVRCASSRARSAAALACFEMFDRNHETAAPTIVKTAHTAITAFAADSKSSSSVRCGGCTASCGLAGVTHLTGEGAIRGADGSSSSASSSAYSCGAGGDRGLPGASAHTPAGHTVQVSKYKIFAHPEGGVRRG